MTIASTTTLRTTSRYTNPNPTAGPADCQELRPVNRFTRPALKQVGPLSISTSLLRIEPSVDQISPKRPLERRKCLLISIVYEAISLLWGKSRFTSTMLEAPVSITVHDFKMTHDF